MVLHMLLAAFPRSGVANVGQGESVLSNSLLGPPIVSVNYNWLLCTVQMHRCTEQGN